MKEDGQMKEATFKAADRGITVRVLLRALVEESRLALPRESAGDYPMTRNEAKAGANSCWCNPVNAFENEKPELLLVTKGKRGQTQLATKFVNITCAFATAKTSGDTERSLFEQTTTVNNAMRVIRPDH